MITNASRPGIKRSPIPSTSPQPERRERVGVPRPVWQDEVERRCLADYDTCAGHRRRWRSGVTATGRAASKSAARDLGAEALGRAPICRLRNASSCRRPSGPACWRTPLTKVSTFGSWLLRLSHHRNGLSTHPPSKIATFPSKFPRSPPNRSTSPILAAVLSGCLRRSCRWRRLCAGSAPHGPGLRGASQRRK
jgi:hypothetical protein